MTTLQAAEGSDDAFEVDGVGMINVRYWWSKHRFKEKV